MDFAISTANVTGSETNCQYPNQTMIRSPDDLLAAVKYDHVCGEFRNNHRSSADFIKSNVLVMDCDNDHSDDPDEWITPAMLEDEFGDFSYAITFSRNHMKVKDGKVARPKFHAYFAINECTDAAAYVELKKAIHNKYPFFDGNALDAARFIYGTDSTEVIWHDGWINIDESIRTKKDVDSIPQGARNSTMFHFAVRIVKRLGVTEEARNAFDEHAERCDPPLPDSELNSIWSSAEKFYMNNIVGSTGYVPPSQYVGSGGTGASLKPEDYSDIGEAKVFLREYGSELLYSDATNYLRYCGNVWVENEQIAIGAIEEFMDLQLIDAKKQFDSAEKALINNGVPEVIVKAGSREVAKVVTGAQIQLLMALKSAEAYLKFVLKRRDYKYIVATGNTSKPMILTDVNDLDADPFLINTPDETYDLRQGIQGGKPHDPTDKITKITNYSPGDTGKDLWLAALETFFLGDAELIEYVQKVVGAAAIGKVYEEYMIIAYGSGANGKSTFWNAIFRVLGTYAGKISAETLTMGCKRNVKPEMAEMKGKRLIIASEMEEGVRMNTAMVKQLSSTDEIQGEKKYKAPFHFTPSHTLVLYTNFLPHVGANDTGIWRRLVVIPFNARITGASDIKNYADYLCENAGSYIMTWIIEGALKAQADHFNLTRPKVVTDAIDSYRASNDWMGHFLEECCDVDPTLLEKSGELYQAYRFHCIQNGEPTRSTTDFYTALEMEGFIKKRLSNGNFIYGLQLKSGQDFLGC